MLPSVTCDPSRRMPPLICPSRVECELLCHGDGGGGGGSEGWQVSAFRQSFLMGENHRIQNVTRCPHRLAVRSSEHPFPPPRDLDQFSDSSNLLFCRRLGGGADPCLIDEVPDFPGGGDFFLPARFNGGLPQTLFERCYVHHFSASGRCGCFPPETRGGG